MSIAPVWRSCVELSSLVDELETLLGSPPGEKPRRVFVCTGYRVPARRVVQIFKRFGMGFLTNKDFGLLTLSWPRGFPKSSTFQALNA